MANDSRHVDDKRGEASRPASLGDRNTDLKDDSMPERYGGAAEEGYGSERVAPTSTDPDALFSAPGHDAGFAGPRFDRADAGSTGTHGVHAVASSSGEAYRDLGTNAGGFASSARTQAIVDQDEESDADKREG